MRSRAVVSLGLLLTLAATAPVWSAERSVEFDIPYAAAGDETKLDLYLPDRTDFATIVFTFGGGWHRGSRKSVAAVAETLQALGYACALPSHRLAPDHKFPAPAEDLAAAFAWVHKHIGEKGGNPRRLVLMGHSSGAHLSLLIAADPIYLAAHGLSPADVCGVIGLSAPVDLEPRSDGKGFGNALLAGRGAEAFSRDSGLMGTASPVRYLSPKLPPTLLVVGERDFPMLPGDAKSFVEKAVAAQVSATLVVAKDRDHMGVIRALQDDHSDVRSSVQDFLARLDELAPREKGSSNLDRPGPH